MNGFALFVAGVAAVVGLCWFIVHEQNLEIADFTRRCLASGQTQAQCAILAEVKRDASNAQISASAAIGFAASK